MQRRVVARVTDVHDELSRIDRPPVSRFIPVAERARIQVELDVLGFAGAYADFIETLKFALGAAALR